MHTQEEIKITIRITAKVDNPTFVKVRSYKRVRNGKTEEVRPYWRKK